MTVQATDPARQPRMSRRTDTQQGQELREEVGPIVNPALLEALGMRGGEASMRLSETTPVDTDSPARDCQEQPRSIRRGTKVRSHT